jgi:hypothetical protein
VTEGHLWPATCRAVVFPYVFLLFVITDCSTMLYCYSPIHCYVSSEILFFAMFINKLPQHVCVHSTIIFTLETILDVTKSLLLLILLLLFF